MGTLTIIELDQAYPSADKPRMNKTLKFRTFFTALRTIVAKENVYEENLI